jgi:hypothetical protein
MMVWLNAFQFDVIATWPHAGLPENWALCGVSGSHEVADPGQIDADALVQHRLWPPPEAHRVRVILPFFLASSIVLAQQYNSQRA